MAEGRKFYLKNPGIVAVTWDDTRKEDDTFHLNESELAAAMTPFRITTVGWLLGEDDGGVLIAEEVQIDPTARQARNVTYILRSGIVEMRKQRTPRKKREKAAQT